MSWPVSQQFATILYFKRGDAILGDSFVVFVFVHNSYTSSERKSQNALAPHGFTVVSLGVLKVPASRRI